MEKISEIVASPVTNRTLLLLLVLVPFLSAFFVSLFGRSSRRIALTLAFVHLGLTFFVVVLGTMHLNVRAEGTSSRTTDIVRFHPTFIPGDTAGKSGEDGRTGWTLMRLTDAPTSANRSGPYVQFFIGMDGLNLWLVALSSIMLIPAILVSWESVKTRPGAFYAWMFFLQGAAIGAFLSFDVILFYVFFELTLIPAFFLIGRWGEGSARRDAARKFFLYTLAGSLLTLIGVLGVVVTNPDPTTGQITFSLPDLMANVQHWLKVAHDEALAGKPEKLASLHTTQMWLFIAMMAGFMVKVPIWPFHTWQPAAYGEAPIGVTILLAALLAKLGTFGILRFVLTLLPDAAIMYGLPVVGSFAAFGIVYAALCAYAQRDMKLMIAYSSVSHLGFLVLAIFAFNAEGLSGSVLHMVNHGLSTGAVFALLAFLLDRYRTTQMSQYGGMMGRFPNFAVLAFILCLASIGLPGLNNFVSEMLMLAGLFHADVPHGHHYTLAFIAAFSIFLSSWYIMTMLQKVFFSPLKEPLPADPETTVPASDVSRREVFAFGSLAGLCLLLGLYPQPILDSLKTDVKALTQIGNGARARVKGEPVPVESATPPVSTANPTPPPKIVPKKGGGGKKDRKDAKGGGGEEEE
ncbi:MAG: NADH-quinone oxidoreductase subunit M [Planctomycetes bacterium]|nr:NADH-quinone oxidoreductase subunit M [Planctomycetota bacterium]